MTKYTAKLVEGKMIIYKHDGDKLIGYAVIYPLIEEPLLLEIDFYNTDGLLETANERLENFGVSSFEQLAKLPPDVIGRMIWGD